MATSTRRSASLALLFLPLLFISASAHTKPPRSCDVKSLCPTTPFPDVCSKSTSLLSPFVVREPTTLARAVLSLSFSSAKSATVHVKTSPFGSKAVRNCEKSMTDAVEVLELAVKEVNRLGRLGRPGTPQYARCLGTAETLVHAAIADANACLKDLGEVQNGVVVSDTVTLTVERTMQLSSNAVVFVNCLNATKPH